MVEIEKIEKRKKKITGILKKSENEQNRKTIKNETFWTFLKN